jgi:putative intracellular protease/amidase
LEEFVSPFFEFIDNGYDMTIASTKGGQPPVDPKSNLEEWQPESTTTFSKEKSAQASKTLVLSQVSASDYDTLFLPGGHGPMWDLSVDKI